jgi:trehalose-6-phosphatase
MKAKEYYEKYKESLNSNNTNNMAKTLANIMKDLRVEYGKIIILRKAQKDSAKLSIIKELNQKWNAIMRLSTNKVINYMQDEFQKTLEERFPVFKEAREFQEMTIKMYRGEKQ